MTDRPEPTGPTGGAARPFDGRVVIVTGAARGLGRDYARYFAEDGASVVLADLEPATAALEAVASTGASCLAVPLDVTDDASTAAMVDRVVQAFGRIDVLVNNAGLWRLDGGLIDADPAAWRAGWAVNVDGTLRCYRAVVPVMARNGFGRIVNISSMASRGGGSVYGLTKNTVNQMTRGMAAEVGDLGITVNCVAPGISAFEGARGAIAGAEQVVAGNIVKRLGTSRDLYGAIRYFCSDEAGWVTGQTLFVDGGATAR
ncbi:MAG: SDR family NAD(P)-dependent oxidoreductase [Acidimicrobiia bacterium]